MNHAKCQTLRVVGKTSVQWLFLSLDYFRINEKRLPDLVHTVSQLTSNVCALGISHTDYIIIIVISLLAMYDHSFGSSQLAACFGQKD